MDSDKDGNVPSPSPDSSHGGTTEQATHDATELTLICVASEHSVQASLMAGAHEVHPQTAADDVKPDAASATPDEETPGAEEGANPPASNSSSTPPPGDVSEKDSSDLVDDQQRGASPQGFDSPSTPRLSDVSEKDKSDVVDDGTEGVAVDQQEGDQIPSLTDILLDPERSDRGSEPDGVVLEEGNAAAASTHVPQRSICEEETACIDHPKEKTSAICETCDVKVCLRCIIGEHRPHEIVPYEDKFEKEDVNLKRQVASIQETLKDTEKLEEKLEAFREKYVTTTQELIARIGKEELASQDKLKEQRDAEIQKINDAYDRRMVQLAERCRQKIEGLQGKEKDRLEDIERRLSQSRELRERATIETQKWTSSQEGMQLSGLKEAIDGAATVSSEMDDTKEVLADSEVHLTPVEDNEGIEEHGELRARVVFGSYRSEEQQTVVSGSLQIKDVRERVATLTKETAKERWDKRKMGDVAVTVASITQNRQYAQGNRHLPFSVEAPDASKPLRWCSSVAAHVVFIPADEAEELAALVGGGSDMKYCWDGIAQKSQKEPELYHQVKSFSGGLTPKGSETVFLQAFLVNKAENKSAIEGKKDEEMWGYHCFFPVDANLQDCVHKLQNLPASTKITSDQDGCEIDASLTVREWSKEYYDSTILY